MNATARSVAAAFSCVLCKRGIEAGTQVVRLSHGPAHAACSAAQQEKIAKLLSDAIAAGTHSTGPVTGVCTFCRGEKVIYWEQGASGGSGIAGRVKLCKECGTARGLK